MHRPISSINSKYQSSPYRSHTLLICMLSLHHTSCLNCFVKLQPIFYSHGALPIAHTYPSHFSLYTTHHVLIAPFCFYQISTFTQPSLSLTYPSHLIHQPHLIFVLITRLHITLDSDFILPCLSSPYP